MAKSGRSRTAAKRLVASGRVSVAEEPTTMATLMVEPGTTVTVHRLHRSLHSLITSSR